MSEFSSGYLTGLLKPKYRVITNILGEQYFPDKGLDVYIDLNTFVSTLSSNKGFLGWLPFSEKVEEDLITSIISTLKHWRDYSRKWNDVRIFMMYNDFDIVPKDEREQLKAYLVSYNNKFGADKYKQMKYYWNEAVKILEPLFDYLPKSYFIRCTKFDSFVIPEALSGDRDKLVVTGNPMMTSYSYDKNARVIYSRWQKHGTGQLSDPLMILQNFTKIDDDMLSIFTENKVFYTLLNVIVGDRDRGIIGLPTASITMIATDLLRAVEKREVPANAKSVESVLSIIEPTHHEYIKKNYPLMDPALHAQMIKPSLIEQTKSKLVDKSDIDALMKFTIGGINLMELV